MNFNKFNSYSTKARIIWIQKVLGVPVTGRRDKVTIKALKKFQEDNNLTGNAMVCEKTFNLLYSNGGKSVSMK